MLLDDSDVDLERVSGKGTWRNGSSRKGGRTADE